MENDMPIILETEEMENMKLPSPELINFYKDLDKRILWIDTDIADNTMEISKYIIKWNMEDDKNNLQEEDRVPIRIFIFSGGGSLYVSNHIVDIITMSKTPVYGYNMGAAMSGALYILLSCHKRYCLKNSVALIHQGSNSVDGNASDVINHVKNYELQLKKNKEYVLSKTTITPSMYKSRQKEDWYLDSKEQIKYGIVERVIDSIEELYK